MKEERRKMFGKFHSLMALAQQLEKKPKRFGTGESLSYTEIHLIETIGEVEGSSVTDISKCLGVTKGAVSQNLKRLEAKGLTEKEPDPENLSRSIVTLTSKGKTAYWAHKHWHETMDGGYLRYLDELDAESFRIIFHFIEKTEDFLKRRIASEE